MEKDKVSIIIPFYNSEKTIKRCLDSIINQTYKNLEIILVSDAGTDNTLDILKEYEKNDSRIKIILKEHTGVSETRNKGLEVATGEYVQFIDSDDDVEPNMVEVMLNAIKKNKADICVTNYTHPSIKNYLGNCVLDIRKKADLMRYYQTTFSLVVPWNKLYKRKVITKSFDKDVAFCEDELFAVSNLKNAKKVVSLNDRLYHYFCDPNVPIEEASCIVKMAREDEFWLKKQTYYFLHDSLYQKLETEFSRFLPKNLASEMAHARRFDFMIWELLIMDQCGADHNGLILEMLEIFQDKRFKQALNYRRQYGLYLKKMSKAEYLLKAREYIISCFKYSEKGMKDDTYNAFEACLNLFVETFMTAKTELIKGDIMVNAYINIHKNDFFNSDTNDFMYQEDLAYSNIK